MFDIYADNVNISNFTITGSGNDGVQNQANFVNIFGNNITNNQGRGIYLYYSSNSVIINNTASSNHYGIDLYSSYNNNIANNNASFNTYGIRLEYSENNNLSNNTVLGNSFLDFSVYDSISSGDNNTCDRPDGWNDNGTIGCRYLSMPIENYPDFIVTNLEFSPAMFNISDSILVNVTVMNIGANFSGDISAGLYADGEYVTEGSTYASLDTDQVTYVNAYWTVNRNGNGSTLTAKADFNNYWAEKNDSNNSFNVTLPYIGASDLVVENITWLPDQYSVGNYMTFKATVRNIGDAPTPSTSVYVKFFIDGTSYYGYWYDPSWYGSLPPNGNFTITSPSWYVSSGQHTVKAYADSYNYVSESKETNNELNIILPDAKISDLIVENITWSPNPFNSSDSVTFTATVRNIGNGSSRTTDNYVGFYLDGNQGSFYTSYWYGSFAPNATYNFTGSWTAVPGNHTVRASADIYNYVQESNESNNDLNASLPYTPGPDLIVENITWLPNPYSAGSPVTFTATVRNIGEASSQNTYHYVRFFIDGNYISEPYWSGSLASNANFTITSSTWTSLPGNHTVRAYADYYYNYIKETNETNNDLNVSLPFTPGPDLVVDNITWSPQDFTAGQTVTFYANIRNAGSLPANGGFYTLFSIDGVYPNSYGTYYSNSIPPDGSISVSQTWIAQGGNHTIVAKADASNYCYYSCYGNRIAETNETNNDNAIVTPYIPFPDIIITNLTWTPYDYSAGDTLVLNATVKNNGTGAWNGPVWVDIYYKNYTSIYASNPAMNLQPGGVAYATATWSRAQAGDFYFRAVVDKYDYYRLNIVESNESNNEFYARSNNVSMPDLMIEGINLKVDHSLVLRGNSNDNVFWKYTTTPTSGWQNFSYDDSDWSTGRTPIGNTWSPRTIINLAGGNGYFRKIFNLTSYDNYFLNIASQDGVDVWVNGAQVLAGSSDIHSPAYWNYQVNITPYIQQGDNSIAIRLKGDIDYWGNSYNYLDAEVVGTTLSSPESAKIEAGDMVTINATVKNTGPGSLSLWYLPTSFYVDGMGLDPSVYTTMNLPVNGTTYVEKTWTATAGNHSISTKADMKRDYSYGYYDAGGIVDEANESNNDLTVSLPSIPYPDLVVEDIYWVPQDYSAGQTVTLYATLRNLGPGSVYSGNGLYTMFFVDGSYLYYYGTFYPYIIRPGERINVSQTWTAQGGNHTVKAIADRSYYYGSYINEINETNNEFTKNLTPILYPDIIITNVTAAKNGITTNVSDFNALDGEPVIFNATIMNLGPGDISATNLAVRFSVDSSYIEGSVNQPLPVNGTANIPATWYATPGNHTFLARADPYNAIQEANESNNNYASVLNPIPYPDLIVANISWSPAKLSDGQNIIFNATIQNTGAGNTSRGFWTRFFIDGAYIGDQYIYGGLASGSSIVTSQNWIASYGKQKVTGFVDYSNGITESNESNNSLSANLSFLDDLYPPRIISTHIDPANITENTIEVSFYVEATDVGYGIDPARVFLNYTAGNFSSMKAASYVSGNTYRATLNRYELDFDAHQGEMITYNFIVYDRGDNRVESNMSYEYIDPINDVPVITIQKPNSASRWKGSQAINWTVNNDNEGPTNSTVYYWKPSPWAPSFLENSTEYFMQGSWVMLTESTQSGSDSYIWDTTGFSGYTKIKIDATDGIYSATKLSDVFIVDNEGVVLEISNYREPGGAYLTTANPVIRGVVDAAPSSVSQISINSSDFNLTQDPRSKTRAVFEFSSGANYTGTYSLNLSAVDEAGNTGSIDGLFLVDSVLPEIGSAEFNGFFTDNPVEVIINATDDYAVDEVWITAFGRAVTLDRTVDGLYHGVMLAPSLTGTYPAEVFVRDSAGNLNSTTYSLDILSGPDLEVNASGISFDPSTLITGGQLNITARISNLGMAKVETVPVAFFADNRYIGSVQANLTESPDATLDWQTSGFAGNVTIGVRIERSANYTETDYTNNNASKEIFIDGPDLAVTGISFNPPSPAYEGQVVAIKATIVNLKPINASNVRISFYENVLNLSNRIDFKDVDVPAGGSVDVSVDWQTAGLSGQQTVFVEANINNLPAEVELSNNVLSSTFETEKYVAEQIPDLLTFPQKTLPGITGEKIRGMASNDFDRDNKTDFVVGTDKGKIVLYRNNGVFYTNNNKTKNVNFTQYLIDDIGEAAWGMTSADLFGDGYPDLIVGTESGRVIFYNNSNGVFVNNITLLDVGDWAYGLAASDFNNDNKFDLVIGNKKGQVDLYMNNMTGGNLTNESFVFNRTLTTRDLPFGMTTGDFDLDGHADVMVGDRLGQIERIVWEIDRYNGFMFADVGSFAHGLTAADVDYSGKLDLFSTSFDGNVRLFYSREGGLVADPLIIGNVPESYGITSGDYDSDNDIDAIVGSDDGNVTMLMNSLRIVKSQTPSPSPPRREIEVSTQIQNPWAREMIDHNLTESWLDNVSFIKGGEWICLDEYCENKFYGDVYFFETPWDNSSYRVEYYFNFSNRVGPVIKVLKREWIPTYYGWVPRISYIDYSKEAILQDRSFKVNDVPSIFGMDMLRLREGYKYKYKLFPESVTDTSAITIVNYTLLGSFNTPNTDYILSDDVTNLNNFTANTKNINPSRFKTDRDYVDNLIIAPDLTPTNLVFTGYSYPPVPGMQITAVATIKNLKNIAINNVKVMLLIGSEPVLFGCPDNCKNYTTLNIGASGTTTVSTTTRLPMSAGTRVNVTVAVNPYRDDIETDYENNNLTNSISTLPPADLSNDRVYFSNGSVIKNVFVEGEPIKIFTNISNIGVNKSFSEDVVFIGAPNILGGPPCCSRIAPVNRVINCAVGSSDYDAELCDGSINIISTPYQHTSPGNIEPGETITTNVTNTLGDFKLRSHGVYNITTIITNAGSLDENHSNDANFAQLIVLPSQEDLQFDYHYCDPAMPADIELSNPDGNNIAFNYRQINIGGYDASNFDSVVYLDNNDSVILGRIRNDSLANHTSDSRLASIDWSSVPPGDHKVNFYLDYGRNDSESTARAVSKDGLIFKSVKPGVSGNGISVSIQNITDESFRLTVIKKKEIVEQTAFDIQTRTETSSITYDQLLTNSDIRTIGDIAEVIRNGGYEPSGFVPGGQLDVEINGANLSAKPTVQSLDLAIPGSLTNERSDFNNEHSMIFRWKEVVLNGITFNPVFPSPRDIVTISSTISNQGDIRTGQFNVTLYIDGLLFETKTVSLPAHDSQPISFLFTVPKDNKTSYGVRIAADPENVITNEDESNNNVSTSIPVSAPFELNIFSREHNVNFLSSYQNGGNKNFTAAIFGLENISIEYDAAPAFVDYDKDEDYDLITGSLDGKLVSYENIGTNSKPVFRETNWSNIDWKPEEVPTVRIGTRYYNTVSLSSLDVGARSVPEFADLDNDSLIDMVIGDTHGRLRSFKSVIVERNVINTATGRNELLKKRAWVEYDFNLSKVDQVLRAVPRFADLDGDGDPDLIVGNQFGKLVGYENTGNASDPDWAHKDFNLSGIDAGANAAPAFGDIDLDGDPDLIVGNRSGISIYENTGNRTDLIWQKTEFSLSLPGRTDYRPALADLDNDGYPDLVFGSNNFTQLKLRKGYFEPVNVQIVNYANNQIDIARIGISVLDATNGSKITDLMLDGPFNGYVGYDNILKGYRIGSQGVFEKEYDLNIPEDLPDNTVLGVTASKQENVNPAYFYELDQNGGLIRGEKPAPVFINRPELGGDTFDLFVEPGATYEYRGSYRVFFNGTMSRQYDCLQNWCALYGLTEGEVNTIVGSGEIRRLIHLTRNDFDIVKPDEPPVLLEIANRSDLKLKPGYIEDIGLNLKNNNRRPYKIDRIAIELYNNSANETWNSTSFDETQIIDLFTDTSGFTLPPEQTSEKNYKVYVPDGVPIGATLLVKAIEKHSLADYEFQRSNIKELWPQGSPIFYDDIEQAKLYNSSDITLFTDPAPWGFQGFDYGLGCEGCGPETSFLRKQVWVPGSLIKSEQREYLHQICDPFYEEPPSGITTWINGKLKSSLATACNEIRYGWTPNFYELNTGKNNELDLYTFGPDRQFDIIFYEMVANDNRSNATINPQAEALEVDVTGIGNHGLLRRQYEEKVNITVTNNDDDPATVDAVTLQLITPQNKKIHLLTDTRPRQVVPGSNINLTYLVLIPSDVPLNSRLMVQVERVFEFPDKLWNRNRDITMPELLADGTKDYHWGDTLPTSESSKYRKRYFAPRNATRAEMILGDRTFSTNAYLNGEFQGSGYAGWSPISISSGLKQGQLNLLSVNGAIPDTENRIYSGFVKTGGIVIEPEEEVYFAAFGVKEKQYLPGREPFFVLPGERVTARIRIENKYNRTRDYTMRLSVVDFKNQNEVTLNTRTLTVLPFEIKKLDVDLTIPDTVSNETRLQLSSVWNEVLSDKNWLRGSNFNDGQASNNYLNDSQWGVVEVGAGNERAIYFRKHLWVDSTVQDIRISKSGVEKMWVNGLEIAGDTLRNEFTKSESNLITLKARDYDIDADVMLDHFVPVRSTDIDSMGLNYSGMFILSQGNASFDNQSLYDCSNQTLGECVYRVEKGDIVRLNFTLRNAGELFARDFNLTVFARNVDTEKITEFNRETITMHPFSTDTWNVSWNTSRLTGGMYEFIVFPDADDDIIETSEYNNQIVRKIYVNAKPEIKYLDSEELQGYNENVTINAEILDEDGNLKNITLNLTKPDNTNETLNLSGSGDLYSATFNGTGRGRYRLHLDAVDSSGKDANDSRNFDIFDSMYLNIKTDKDLYFYTQKVRLTQPGLSNLTKLASNNNPVLVDAFDNMDRIKGGDRITIQTHAFDPDGDLMTLYVCKGNQAGATGCTGGTPKTYCSFTGLLNPACSFNTEKDDITHDWFAFVVDKRGLIDGPIAGNYTTDSTPPATRIYSFAGDRHKLVDTQNDLKTIVTIQGEPGLSCRFGKDEINRFHKDRSYSLLEKECSASNGYANCNLGNLIKDDPSKDRITNLTRAYVSCKDELGNEQTNLQNIDLEFGIEPENMIFDDYQGDILVPGSTVNISGSTSYCVDGEGNCTPDTKIDNGSVVFNESGVYHLRYNDTAENIKETTVFVNSRPEVSDPVFTDHLGEHAFDVTISVHDPDRQAVTCTLRDGSSTLDIPVVDGVASATLNGDQNQTVTTRISCTDGFETISIPRTDHTFPNQAPQLRNVPDISLETGETITIDLSYFGFDIENDALAYSMVSQSDTGAAIASISAVNLSVTASAPGTSAVCLKARDGLADSNVQCMNVFVEDGFASELQNNEFTETMVKLLMQVQYYNGSWQDEFTKETKLKVLPGAKDRIDLSRLFEWNSTNSSHPEGLFRVLFRAADENNNTLINRDGKEIIDSYNFTLVLFNTPPRISGIPDQLIFENDQARPINLLDYTSDGEQNIADLDYAIVNQTNPGLINCSISDRHIISCETSPNQTGTSEINISVFDGFAFDYDTFAIKVVPYEEFVKAGNITYTFISDRFDVSGDPYSGFRHVSVGEDIPQGRYNITVIVSNGVLNVSKDITVIVMLPGTPILDTIGNRVVRENETLAIQLNGTDPDGNPLTYGTDAEAVLPGAVLFNGITGLFEWSPGFDDSGNYSVSFNVTNGNFTANETINITVLNANRQPVLEFIPDITVNESDLITITSNATDPDNQNSVTNDDNNLTLFINDTRFTKTGNNFTWLTGFGDAGNFSVIITVGDGELTDYQEVNITILKADAVQILPKVVYHSPDGSNVPVNALMNVTFNKEMNRSSVENAFLITPLLTGVFNWMNNTLTFDPGLLSYNATYRVNITDAAEDIYGNHLQQAFSWEFTTQAQANRPPVADDQSVTTIENTPAAINLTASDPDNDSLTFIIVTLPASGVLSGSLPNLTYTPDANFNGTDSFIFNVSDGKLYSNNALVRITINPAVQVPDNTPPEGITDLRNITYSQMHINWTWTDPSDTDFKEVSIYLNGIFQSNVTAGMQYYNATELRPDTVYEISTLTVDRSGNINQTWVNDTERTAPVPSIPDTTPPAGVTGLHNITYSQTYINWTWTDPSDTDFKNVLIYLNGTFITNVPKGIQYYNATDLTPDTMYELGTLTTDQSGNINQTWNNDTERTSPVSPIRVSIDIKPRSFPNSINPQSSGVIPVAILSDSGFDATTRVDVLSVRFGPAGAGESHSKGHFSEDVNNDSLPDLVLHFETRDTGLLCGDTYANLAGKTVEGSDITGSDSIITVGCNEQPSGNNGGNGRRNGVITAEPFDNIARSDTVENDIMRGQSETYDFPSVQCTYELSVTGAENENDIAIRVEELKGPSKLVAVPPPGEVYRNVNIWAGTKRIKEALLRCKVNNSWMTSNDPDGRDVKFLRWNNTAWQQLETRVIRKDSMYTYYEAKTYGFSHFAVASLKSKAVAAETPGAEATGTPEIKPTAASIAPATNLSWIIYVFIVLIISSGVYFFFYKKR